MPAGIETAKDPDDDDDDKTVQPEDPNVEPPAFTSAVEQFGKRTRRDLGYFLEAYIQMCVAAEQEPVPRSSSDCFQSRDKKNLL